jgi:hypothetical protein
MAFACDPRIALSASLNDRSPATTARAFTPGTPLMNDEPSFRVINGGSGCGPTGSGGGTCFSRRAVLDSVQSELVRPTVSTARILY